MRRIALVVAVLGALAAGTADARVAVQAGPAAVGWTSNVFVSPTRNIHCRYFPGKKLMACTTQNDDFMTAVTLWGKAYHRQYTYPFSFPDGPRLEYGDTWKASGRFKCWSKTSGMTCESLKTSHGFFINRDSYDTW